MIQTTRLGLPLLAAGQAQKEVTHNEALLAIDRLLALTVVSRTTSVPPTAAPAGAAYIVPAAGVDGWDAPADTVMCHDGHGWLAMAPPPGALAYVSDEAAMCVFVEGWTAGWPAAGIEVAGRRMFAGSPAAVAAPAGGANIDAEARATLAQLLDTLRGAGILA